MPDRLGCPPAEVSRLTARAPHGRIDRDFRLLDTPGRDALSGLDDYVMESIGQADALLYVTARPGEDDRKALEDYGRRAVGAGLTTGGVSCVPSRIDGIGDGRAGLTRQREQAARMARRAARSLGGLVAAAGRSRWRTGRCPVPGRAGRGVRVGRRTGRPDRARRRVPGEPHQGAARVGGARPAERSRLLLGREDFLALRLLATCAQRLTRGGGSFWTARSQNRSGQSRCPGSIGLPASSEAGVAGGEMIRQTVLGPVERHRRRFVERFRAVRQCVGRGRPSVLAGASA